ncbi:peptidylprolyl isomerase [Melioribacter sp. Ez-97]|uniref:peptidylprolyl isomerase n=1 Tax=Melioribacter sp. Ez-97 TaxID=3423434 RepID=UPI003ED931F2
MKRIVRSAVLFYLIILTSFDSFSQTDSVFNKIYKLSTEDNRVMEHQHYLCNVFGGRLTGSNAYTNAAKWALSKFKEWGLDAYLDEVGEMPVGFDRGPWFGKMIEPYEKKLTFGTPSYTASTKGVQEGDAIYLPDSLIIHSDNLKDTANGKWVLIEGENNGWARDRDSISIITTKLINAGALGTIQKSPFPLRLLESRCVNSWDNLPVLPDIKLLAEEYDEILNLIQENKPVKLQFDIRNHFFPGPVKYHNVIGVLKGAEKPGEYVILGAHLDSFDGATGAIDNGSGAARMMEAVRLLSAAGAKPKRSIMIQLYAAEERGLVGSKSWIEKNKSILDKISIMFNNDGGTNPLVALGLPESIIKQVEGVLNPIKELKLEYPFSLDTIPRFRRAGRGGTDSHSFIMNGVPAPWLILRGPHVYRRTWHSIFDTYNEVIPSAQKHSSLLIALAAYQIANMDSLISRSDAFLPEGLYAELNTNKGRILINLDYKRAPLTVANFVGLAEGTIKNSELPEGVPYYNGSIWHRVVPGHVIQAGKPVTGAEGPGYEFPNEISPDLHHNKAGMVGMANAGPHTNGSQFYITLADRSYLDGNYTLFGEVEEGMDVVFKITEGDTIKRVQIIRIGDGANKFRPTTDSFLGLLEQARKRVLEEEKLKKKLEEEKINKLFPGLETYDDGSRHLIINEGADDDIGEVEKIKVRYSGFHLLNEQKFYSDSLGLPGISDYAEDFYFAPGKTNINPGLNKYIPLMKKGEKRIIILPSSLAYGIYGYYGRSIVNGKRFVIPPNSTLVYEIEVIDRQ